MQQGQELDQILESPAIAHNVDLSSKSIRQIRRYIVHINAILIPEGQFAQGKRQEP